MAAAKTRTDKLGEERGMKSEVKTVQEILTKMFQL